MFLFHTHKVNTYIEDFSVGMGKERINISFARTSSTHTHCHRLCTLQKQRGEKNILASVWVLREKKRTEKKRKEKKRKEKKRKEYTKVSFIYDYKKSEIKRLQERARGWEQQQQMQQQQRQQHAIASIEE